ncbi:MAG: DUF4087 domain-containing protein [Beijerinckiaceae bacterium]
MRNLAISAILALGLASPAHAALRCGWLSNPTPANWWLQDKDGEWTLSIQGRGGVPGFDDIPDMSTRGWVVTNGSSYGYGCACIEIEAGAKIGDVKRMGKATPRPLSACRADPKLPKRPA